MSVYDDHPWLVTATWVFFIVGAVIGIPALIVALLVFANRV